MKREVNPSLNARLIRGAFYVLLLLAAFVISLALGQQSSGDSAINAAKMSLAVGVSSTSGASEVQSLPTPVVASTAFLVWDQYDSAGTAATLSATFTDAPAMNSDLADDFEVPAGTGWVVRWIDVDGAYFNGPGPANSFTVSFYADNDRFPGNQVYSTVAPSWEQNGSTFTIHVCYEPFECFDLYPGRYWVEIQANMTAKCCGEWGWTDRTVTSLNPAVWRNPSGFFGACTSWSRRAAKCGLDPLAPDQVYRIYASVLVVPTPTPTSTVTPTPTVTTQFCSVTSPLCDFTVFTPPTTFDINVLCGVDPATVQASDLTVNGIPADTFTLINGNTTIRFQYINSPAVPGQNTMHIAASAFNCCNAPVPEFTCTFTYQIPTVTPTLPPPSPTATLTATPTLTPRVALTPRVRSTPPPRP